MTLYKINCMLACWPIFIVLTELLAKLVLCCFTHIVVSQAMYMKRASRIVQMKIIEWISLCIPSILFSFIISVFLNISVHFSYIHTWIQIIIFTRPLSPSSVLTFEMDIYFLLSFQLWDFSICIRHYINVRIEYKFSFSSCSVHIYFIWFSFVKLLSCRRNILKQSH